jgi:hypothetical protein
VTTELRKEVFARYGLPWSEHSAWTVDHLIPCELSGASTLANLWPQRIADAERKDRLEEKLHELALSGQLDLHEAQSLNGLTHRNLAPFKEDLMFLEVAP